MIDVADTVSPDEVAWLVLALVGVAIHVDGLVRYGRYRPRLDDEARVRRMGLVSSVVHIGIKLGFLLGAVYAMTQPWPALTGAELYLLYAWRASVLGTLVALDVESFYLRANREALARARMRRDIAAEKDKR